MFPLFNFREGVSENNIGYTQGVLQDQFLFAAEVWKYEDEENLVVYLPDLRVTDRNGFGVEKRPEYDLSVLSRCMRYKFTEKVFEVNEFYKEYLEELGILQFTSNMQNGYVAYFEDQNGLEMVAFYVVLRIGDDLFAEYLLPLTPFAKNNDCEEDKEKIIMECSVDIFQDKEYVATLGAGSEFIYGFAKKADCEIPGSIQTEKGWGCNRDVTIRGTDLLVFIQKEYPKEYPVYKDIINKQEIYKIIATDFS